MPNILEPLRHLLDGNADAADDALDGLELAELHTLQDACEELAERIERLRAKSSGINDHTASGRA